MKHIKSYQIFNESVLVGKMLGQVSKGLDKVKRMIGLTGRDEDLADEILLFLDNKLRNSSYVNDTRFDKTMIQKPLQSQFVFFGRDIFKQQGEKEVRIDVIKASDPSIGLHGDPFRVYVSIVTKTDVTPTGNQDTTSSGRTKTTRRRSDHNLLITANPKQNEKMEQLDCSNQAAEKIWNRCEEIYRISSPTTKGTVRGGNNNPDPRSGNVFRRLGLSW